MKSSVSFFLSSFFILPFSKLQIVLIRFEDCTASILVKVCEKPCAKQGHIKEKRTFAGNKLTFPFTFSLSPTGEELPCSAFNDQEKDWRQVAIAKAAPFTQCIMLDYTCFFRTSHADYNYNSCGLGENYETIYLFTFFTFPNFKNHLHSPWLYNTNW